MSRTAYESIVVDSGITPAPEPARIAVFQALNLGDFLCATPALRAIRRRYPRADITMIGRPWARDLVARLPSVDRFHPFPGFPGIVESPNELLDATLAAPACDLAIQMHGSGSESNGYIASLRSPWSIGYGPPGDARLTVALPWIEDEPEPLRWLRLVAAVGASVEHTRLDMPITMEERQAAARLLGAADGQLLIGMHVGSSLPDRRWPAASFAALADSLARELNARIILTGGPQERELTAAVQRAMHAPALDLAGQTTIGEYAAVIAALDLLVTNDTSASHIAAATGTRSVVLFGPTRPARWAPLDLRRHHIIDAKGVHPGLDGAAALQQLSPAFVTQRCLGALREAQAVRGATVPDRLS